MEKFNKIIGIVILVMGFGLLYGVIPYPSPPPQPVGPPGITYVIELPDNPDNTHMVGLDWDDSPEPYVCGYWVYQRAYPLDPDEGPVDTKTYTEVSQLDSIYIDLDTYAYYGWCVTAYDTYGRESEPSDTTYYPSQSMPPKAVAEGKMVSPYILKAYPNPASSMIRLSYSIEKRGWICLDLYDATGRRVRTLERGDKVPGLYEEKLSNLTPGVYFVSLRIKNHTETLRFTVVR